MPDAPASSPPSLTIVRTIAAPVAQVFAAWTDPSLLQRWLAPNPCQVLDATADARPGGHYRIVVVDPAGNRHVTTGEYREVVPNERLVQTWVYEGPDPAADRSETLLSVEFREAGPDTTELTLRHDRFATLVDREGTREGWRLCLNQLDALVSRQATAS